MLQIFLYADGMGGCTGLAPMPSWVPVKSSAPELKDDVAPAAQPTEEELPLEENGLEEFEFTEEELLLKDPGLPEVELTEEELLLKELREARELPKMEAVAVSPPCTPKQTVSPQMLGLIIAAYANASAARERTTAEAAAASGPSRRPQPQASLASRLTVCASTATEVTQVRLDTQG